MEMSTVENEAAVRAVCESVSAAHADGKPVSAAHQAIYDVDYLLSEVNSGASFEQYFRWATLEEIARVVPALRTVGLSDVADLTEQAMRVAFPSGLPANDSEHEELTDWSEAQEDELGALFPAFEDHNGRITNMLAGFAQRG